jgi:hypothetical protein
MTEEKRRIKDLPSDILLFLKYHHWAFIFSKVEYYFISLMFFQVEVYRRESHTRLDSTWNPTWLVVGWFFSSLGQRH